MYIAKCDEISRFATKITKKICLKAFSFFLYEYYIFWFLLCVTVPLQAFTTMSKCRGFTYAVPVLDDVGLSNIWEYLLVAKPEWPALFVEVEPGWPALLVKDEPGWPALFVEVAPGWPLFVEVEPGWPLLVEVEPGLPTLFVEVEPGWPTLFVEVEPGWPALIDTEDKFPARKS